MARGATYVMVELYSNYRLFQIPEMVVTQSRSLDLAGVLGSRDAAYEYNEILALMSVVDFDNVPHDHYAKKSGVAQNPADRDDANGKAIRPAGVSRFIWFISTPGSLSKFFRAAHSFLKDNHGKRSRPDNQLYGFVYTDLNGRQTDFWHVLNDKCEPITDSEKEANPKKTETPRGGAPDVTPGKNWVDEDGYGLQASLMDTRVDDLPARNKKFRRGRRNDHTLLPSLDNHHTPRGRVGDVGIRRGEEGDLSVSSDEQFQGQRNPYYP